MAVLSLAAFLVLDSGSGRATASPTTAAADGETGTLSGDVCVAASQALASAAAGIGGTALDQGAITEAFERMSAVAPTAVQADLGVMGDAIDDLFLTLVAAGIDLADPNTMASEEAQAALTRASAALDVSGYEEAAGRVEAWLEAECAEVTG